jgi:hypothetical protein
MLVLLHGGGAARAQTTQPARPTVLAFGTSDQYWVANVESYREGTKAKYKTLVRGQSLPAGDWRDLGVVLGQAAALAETQGELAILLDDGSWKRLGGAGLATGPALPGTGPVMAWGSARGVLYAVRGVEGGREAVTTRPVEMPDWTYVPATRPTAATTTMPATTQSATARPAAATAATRPTTRPAALTLLRYEKGQWVGVADVPVSALVGATSLSLSGVGNKPLLAVATETGPIHTYLLDDSQWKEAGEVRPGGRPVTMGALSTANLPAIWTVDQDGAMKLFLKREGEEWAGRTLEAPGVPPNAQRALAAAGDEFRLVLSKDGKLWEQRYDLSGAPRGTLTEMPVPVVYKPDPFLRILQYFVVLGMVVVMLVTFYKRRAATRDAGEKDE